MTDRGPVLEVLSGDLAGRAYAVDQDEFVIGRSRSCNLVLPKRYISREHVRIVREEDEREFVVDSLSRKNPVRVRDRAVREHVLADGDEFETCGIRFRFLRSGAPQPQRRRAPAASMPASGSTPGDAPTPDPDVPPRASARDLDPPTPDPDVPARASTRDLDPPTPDPDAPAPRRSGSRASRASTAAGEKKVVFEVDDRAAEADQTGAVAPPPSSKGSGDDARERTAELGKLDDPDDPFAQVGPIKPKSKGADAARERMLRMLTVVGILAILGSAGVLWKLSIPPEWKPPESYGPPVVARLDEAVTFTVDWTPEDPPEGDRSTLLSGEPVVYFEDPLVRVEWLCPHVDAHSTFLVVGKEPGDTRMLLRFGSSHRQLYVDIQVANESIHGEDGARGQRRERLSQEHGLERLRELAAEHAGIGEGFTAEREVPGKEMNYRRALLEFQLASDYANAARMILARQGTVPQEDIVAVQRCEEREGRARNEYEDYARRQVALYRDSIASTPEWADQVSALKRALRAISHECDPDFQRLRLLLEDVFKTPWEDEGAQRCDLR